MESQLPILKEDCRVLRSTRQYQLTAKLKSYGSSMFDHCTYYSWPTYLALNTPVDSVLFYLQHKLYENEKKKNWLMFMDSFPSSFLPSLCVTVCAIRRGGQPITTLLSCGKTFVWFLRVIRDTSTRHRLQSNPVPTGFHSTCLEKHGWATTTDCIIIFSFKEVHKLRIYKCVATMLTSA